MPEITISLSAQQLRYIDEASNSKSYPVSTSLNGPGQHINSGKTPIGKHIVRAKIGQGMPINSVFVARRPTGEICTPQMMSEFPDRDWILTRILWLSGKQPGFNRLGDVDTMRRYIYIHGTPYEAQLGRPVSRGCIRMANKDVIELFDLVPLGCVVEIVDS